MLAWQERNRDKVRAANRKWAAANPETRREIKTRYDRNHGIAKHGTPAYRAKLSANMKRRYPWPDRFWNAVEKDGPQVEGMTGECWIWTASTVRGYGTVRLDGKRRRAHRVSYEMAKGPIPEGLDVDHLCFNPPCVNPDHLEAVTREENLRRRRART